MDKYREITIRINRNQPTESADTIHHTTPMLWIHQILNVGTKQNIGLTWAWIIVHGQMVTPMDLRVDYFI